MATTSIAVRVPRRARFAVRYVRWRGPVRSARDGLWLHRNRQHVRRGVRVARIAAVAGSAAYVVARGAIAAGRPGSLPPT